ncbi:MAG: zinc ribbon domain-containing protein [Acidimicrobiales bacterium]
MGSLDTLLVVQQHDLALDRLAHRRDNLPERAAIVALMSDLAMARMAEGMARIAREDLAGLQARLEADAEAIGVRIADIEQRLYGGSVSAPRELSAMAAEVESLRRQRSGVEDRLLAAMEEAEPMDAELEELVGSLAGMEAEQARLMDALADAETVIEAEAAIERASRQDLAASLPGALSERYEGLRVRLGGIGVAKLHNGSCDGCHLALPAAERERLRRLGPDELATCDQCGRILVP